MREKRAFEPLQYVNQLNKKLYYNQLFTAMYFIVMLIKL